MGKMKQKMKYMKRILLFILVIATAMGMIVCTTHGKLHSQEPKITSPASIIYYGDAEGTFTITPPQATIGFTLPLRGTCSLPEIMLKIDKKGGRSRSACIRLEKIKEFQTSYLIKDGPGEYRITIFGKRSVNALTGVGLCTFTIYSTEPLPKDYPSLFLNKQVIRFVKEVMGTTVGSGECWDLAQEALDRNGADWNRPLEFGMPLDPEKEQIEPGDIIQFRSVTITERLPNGAIRREVIGVPDHTAVILSVEGKKRYLLAHQNINGKRYVISSAVNLNAITSGRYYIYRPIAGFAP